MLRTSASFDEIVFMCVGARGIDTGDFSLVIDHPRLPQYIYGLPVYLMHVKYPPEGVLTHDWMPRYYYARTLLWGLGNPAEHIMMVTRTVALAFGAATLGATFVLARRRPWPHGRRCSPRRWWRSFPTCSPTRAWPTTTSRSPSASS